MFSLKWFSCLSPDLFKMLSVAHSLVSVEKVISVAFPYRKSRHRNLAKHLITFSWCLYGNIRKNLLSEGKSVMVFVTEILTFIIFDPKYFCQ